MSLAFFVALSLLAGADLPLARTGPIHIVEVTAPDRAALADLVAAGYDVSNVRGWVATVYATEEERDRLLATGYPCVELPAPGPAKVGDGYHTFATMTTELQDDAAAYPDICRLTSIGTSVEGRDLWVILITNHPDIEEDEPEFKYVSTIHGDEAIGTENCLRFIQYLLSNYGTDEQITRLIDTTSVSILPLMNPDGFVAVRRYNAQGYDLNRSFPTYPSGFLQTMFDDPTPSTSGRPVEVAEVMQWIAANSFTLSANFHSGSLVVNYPYDDAGRPSGVNTPTPDDTLFRDISKRYSIHNLPMWNSGTFQDGITNGTAWYVVVGGMQDWNYRYASCNEVTIELSDTKRPDASQLDSLWNDNREAMLAYLEAVQIGVRGIVADRATGAPLFAEVRVEGNSHPVFTDPDIGDYHRMLLPGTYTLTFAAPGYGTRTVENVVVGGGEATRLDVTLDQGDVNHDGAIDALDVQLVINAILGLYPDCDCDIDGGGVTSTDLQAVVNIVLGIV